MQCPELVVGESKQGHKCCINFHWGNEKGPLLLIRLEREKNDRSPVYKSQCHELENLRCYCLGTILDK